VFAGAELEVDEVADALWVFEDGAAGSEFAVYDALGGFEDERQGGALVGGTVSGRGWSWKSLSVAGRNWARSPL
jgi:hypothetical protein